MRIVFVISSLGSGGAERVASLLCNTWQAIGHEVYIVNFEAPGTPSFYPISEGVQILQLDLLRNSNNPLQALQANISRIATLRRTFRQLEPDVILAFMTETGILSSAALLGSKVPLVISERIDPQVHPTTSIWQRMRQWAYPRSAAIVVQTERIRDHIATLTGVQARIISNPVKLSDYQNSEANSAPQNQPLELTAIGRLNTQKGYDILINAIAKLKSTDVQLTIYGDGPQRNSLHDLIRQHHLETKVHLAGRTQQVPRVLTHTDIFIHSARYEGYPNVVIEALAAGCCVLATDDSGGGTRELIGKNQCGLLVPADNVEALASALDSLISDKLQRARYAASARHAVSHLDTTVIAETWISLFEELLAI